MIRRPASVEEAARLAGPDAEFRAGGTDVEARRRIGLATPDLVDLGGVPGLDTYELRADGATLGSATRIGRLAGERAVLDAYPALALTAASLANPHTRAVGTLGGNLAQRTRCWYYRTGQVDCHMTGGDTCQARGGVDDWAVVFDVGPCIAPHPSSLAMALMAYGARVGLSDGRTLSVEELLGDGSDPTDTIAVTRDLLITSVFLPAPLEAERAAYWRATGRMLAEWPTVEAVARLSVVDDRIAQASVAVGGVAPVPMRLHSVEDALTGRSLDAVDLASAADLATSGADPLPSTAYKLDLLRSTVLEVVERALSGDVHSEATFERWL